jgi:outer membrane protein assembly factor BamB
VAWKVAVPGEGASSPVVWGDSVFVTSALEEGTVRVLHCLDRRTGRTRWRREVSDPNPERTSALAGHAASTPATDGSSVVAFFGNAGVVCYGFDGERAWHRSFGEFDSELGLASSPVLYRDVVLLVCDHDDTRFRTFGSFLIALDLRTGETRWKTERPGLERSWSTPVLAPDGGGRVLVVNAQDELRGYDSDTGALRWRVGGMSGWVTPSPVFGRGLIFATSGKNGPTVAVRADGRVVWREERGGPYVCSPLLYGDWLYVIDEAGVLTCRDAARGEVAYRVRLRGKFTASPVAGDGKVYFTNEEGRTTVVQAGPEFRPLAENSLDEECLASPAVSRGALFFRTRRHLYCIRE